MTNRERKSFVVWSEWWRTRFQFLSAPSN